MDIAKWQDFRLFIGLKNDVMKYVDYYLVSVCTLTHALHYYYAYTFNLVIGHVKTLDNCQERDVDVGFVFKCYS